MLVKMSRWFVKFSLSSFTVYLVLVSEWVLGCFKIIIVVLGRSSCIDNLEMEDNYLQL